MNAQHNLTTFLWLRCMNNGTVPACRWPDRDGHGWRAESSDDLMLMWVCSSL